MAYTSKTMIYVLSKQTGYLPALRQQGPIVNPLKVTVAVAKRALITQIELYEFDPKSGKAVLLTLKNLMDDTKFDNLPSASEIIAANNSGKYNSTVSVASVSASATAAASNEAAGVATASLEDETTTAAKEAATTEAEPVAPAAETSAIDTTATTTTTTSSKKSTKKTS